MDIGSEASIVVGVDGSAASMEAVLWAAAEAQRRGAALSLIHAYTVPRRGGAPGFVPDDTGPAAAALMAEQLLDQAAAAVRKTYPGMSVSTRASEESPVAALKTASRHAVLTVVGSHGRHQLTETLLGSVAARVTGHAHSPVVVIRTDPQGRPAGGEGPVVVGVDGSPESDDALAFALQEAATRRTALIAIRTWDDTTLDGFQGGYPVLIDREHIAVEERQLLLNQVEPWRAQYPEVPLHLVVLAGRPAPTLLTFCENPGSLGTPCLLVVGSRGRGGFTGMVLGSTSHALIAHASFGVAVVRPVAAA